MAYKKFAKGGAGGKKGHSNMSHWTRTEEIKQAHKKNLRKESRELCRQV